MDGFWIFGVSFMDADLIHEIAASHDVELVASLVGIPVRDLGSRV
jgi:hypothetical protein